MNDTVCAVIVTFERATLLRRCLDALLGQTRPPDAVIVVDNASTDGTREMLHAEFPHARTISLPRNVGSAGGFAAGMAAALALPFDWIWLMDDDVAAEAGCLGEMLEVASLSGKPVVVPRRLDPGGRDLASEAVLMEAAQRFEGVTADPARHRYRLIDLFTFEGPLVHRSVIEAVGLPDQDVFIRGEDILYAVRINRQHGPLSCALAARAIVRRQLPRAERVQARSRIKQWISGDGTYDVLGDPDHWKAAYELRNRHLVWRALGWRRRRARLLVVHLGYVAVDLAHALRRGWHWRLRLRYNLAAWWLGLLGRDASFLDPGVYRARLARRRAGRTGSPPLAAEGGGRGGSRTEL